MTSWLSILKTVLPYLTPVVTAAIPAFNTKKDNEQVAELQAAVKHNAESIRMLAAQMERTIHAIEAGAVANERALKHARAVSVIALAVALISLLIACIAVFA